MIALLSALATWSALVLVLAIVVGVGDWCARPPKSRRPVIARGWRGWRWDDEWNWTEVVHNDTDPGWR